jgi:hypothetical protein
MRLEMGDFAPVAALLEAGQRHLAWLGRAWGADSSATSVISRPSRRENT